jgi:long-subunit acyl-CoA synthetase (AMP-forming)
MIGVLGSVGTLAPGTSAKVVKRDGSLAGVGEPGELYVKGPQVTLGYYKNEKEWPPLSMNPTSIVID